MAKKFIYIYYLAIILALVLYTNMDSSPSMLVRLAYLAALVIPLVKRTEWFPAIIICAFGIADNTFAYPLMPTDLIYYVVLALAFAILTLSRREYHTEIHPLFPMALVYVALNDIALQGELSDMSIVFFIFILFFLCLEGQNVNEGIQILPISFILISLAICYWVLFCPEAEINSYNKLDEMEQKVWSDPNYLSAILGMGLVIAVRDLFKGDNKALYAFILVLTVFGSTVAMLTLASRGAIISVILSVAALFVLSKTKRRTKVVAILLAAVFIVFLYTNQYTDFFVARIEAEDGTGTHRTEIWYSKLRAFLALENPISWFLGVGQSEGTQLGDYLGQTVKALSTHNDYLSILIYYGIVGLALLYSVITYPLRICKKEERPQIISLLVYLLMCSMTIEPLANGSFVYWGLFFYIIIQARDSQTLAASQDSINNEED